MLHLVVQNSSLWGIHTKGLSGCTALTKLEFRRPHRTHSNKEVYLNPDLTLVHADIGLLTQLHTMDLTVSSNLDGRINLEWNSALTCLQDLSISFSGSHGKMLQHAAVLTNLTSLDITSRNAPSDPDGMSVLSIKIKWHRLQSLQCLSIRGVRLELGDGVAGLLQLHHLRKILFAGSMTDGEQNNGRCCFFVQSG